MIWTVSHAAIARHAAREQGDDEASLVLLFHGPLANHCGGWEVIDWPCPTAAKVLDRLLGGAA